MSRLQTAPRLTSVAVSGFKSIRDRIELDLGELTLLAGRNSSGKSSFLQPLLLMKQTLEAPFDAGPLLLAGPHAQFSSGKELVWGSSRKGGETGPPMTVVFRRSSPALDLALAINFEVSGGVELSLDSQRFRIRGDDFEYEREIRDGQRLRSVGAALTAEARRLLLGAEPPAGILRVRRNRCFLEYVSEHAGTERSIVPPSSLSQDVRRMLLFLLHLPGLRGSPARSYAATGSGRRSARTGWSAFAGPFHPYTASVLASWQDDGDPRVETLGAQLADLGLTWKAQTKRLDATRIEVQVARLPQRKNGSGDLVNIADVGVGVSQTLPLLVALLTAQPGQIVYVEQPEIHLHPAAQHALARCLVAAAKRGVRVIAETHSNLLLQGVLTEVAKGEFDPKLLKLYWFARDDEGATHVTAADVDKHGTFGEWPVDFGEIEMASMNEYLAASMHPVGPPAKTKPRKQPPSRPQRSARRGAGPR